MQVTYFVIVLTAALGLTLALPANKNEQTTQKDLTKEVDFVPVGNKNFGAFPPGGVVDVDAGSFFGESPIERTPFISTFSSIEAAFARMQRLVNQLLGRLPSESDFPELHIPNFGNVDLGKGNTTSVTKIINGHKVTINDTEYKSDGADSPSFFKVHIVEVHPDNEDPTNKKDVEPVSSPKRDPESVGETFTNEIPKIKDNEGSKSDENIETLDEADVASSQQSGKQQWNKLAETENFEDNRIDSAPPKPYDLSNDIYVNQLLADSGAKTNPDAEIFTPAAQYYPEARMAPSRVAPFNFYPNNVYEQREAQPFQTAPFYAPPIPVSDPYYSRFQPEQIMIVPLGNDPQTYFVPPTVQGASSLTQAVNSNVQTVPSSTSSMTIPDKSISGPSRT